MGWFEKLFGRNRAHGKRSPTLPVEKTEAPCFETVTQAAEAQYVHRRIESRDFVRLEIGVAPLERGGGLEYLDDSQGVSVPRKHLAAVEEGIREALAAGTLRGAPVTDIKVTLICGRELDGNSTSEAWRKTACEATRRALAQAAPMLVQESVKLETRREVKERTSTKAEALEEKRRLEGLLSSPTDELHRSLYEEQLKLAHLLIERADLLATRTREDLEAQAAWNYELADYLRR